MAAASAVGGNVLGRLWLMAWKGIVSHLGLKCLFNNLYSGGNIVYQSRVPMFVLLKWAYKVVGFC